MNEIRLNAQKHKRFLWPLVLFYSAFHGCFTFPFSNEMFPFDFTKAILIIFGYGIMGILYVGLFDQEREIAVLMLTLFLTIIGLVFRYLLEFGEVSNTINFIPVNIVLFLVLIPIYSTLVYWASWKCYAKTSVTQSNQ